MMEKRDLSAVADQVTDDELLTTLLEATGDLDKAQVLRNTLPAWLAQAQPATLAALEQAHRDSELPRRQVKRLLEKLQPLHAFCVERLHTFLLSKGVQAVDVEHDQLELPKVKYTGMMPPMTGPLIETITWTKRSLVTAAMQNFDAAKAGSGGLPARAVIRSAATGHVVTELTVEQFVGYCRELDVGQAYQRHLREVFNLPAPHEQLLANSGYNPAAVQIGQSKLLDMQIDLHMACARQDVSAAAGERLLKLIKADRSAEQLTFLTALEKPWVWQGLNIDGACLWGVLVIGDGDPGEFGSGSLLVYMPNEPVRPWFEYEALEDFEVYLTLKLQVASYRKTFETYLDEHERLGFFQRFDQTRQLKKLAPMVIAANFSSFYFNAFTGKAQRDALALAVPTAQVDEEADQARWQAYLEAGLDLLNVASFVVPVLGQLMMGVAVGQLLGEVFEGVEDWAHHDDAEALRHLINIGESIAAMIAFAAGGRIVGALKKRVLSGDFFGNVEAITRADLQPRLWRPRLAPYSHALPPEPWAPNSLGIHQAKGKSWVRIDGAVYCVEFDPGIGQWRIHHPTRPSAYRPALNHNHHGGWQHAFEQPEHWHDLRYNLIRIDPKVEALNPADATSIAAITELNLPHARRLALDHQPLPQRFQDCRVRVEQHYKVERLIGQLGRGEVPAADTARVQMLAIPLMPGWPKGRFIEVLDDEEFLLESYPNVSPFDYEDLSVHITQQQLQEGQVMQTILQALTEEERTVLLGEAVALDKASPLLQQRLLPTLQTHQQALTQKLFLDQEGLSLGELHSLKNAHPSLSNRVASQLLGSATHVQRERLRKTGRVPLMLAEHARGALARMEEDHALTGLYFPEQALPATRRIALGVAQQLSGWPRELSLQLRQQSVNGEVLAQVASPSETLRRTVVQTAEGFQPFDESNQSLAEPTGGAHGFYQAMVQVLPLENRLGMGLMGDAAPQRLLSRIRFNSQDQRRRVRAFMHSEVKDIEAEPVACVQAAPPALPSSSPALMRKMRTLYPLLDDTHLMELIEEAGSDQLSRSKAVQGLEQQLDMLHRALKIWRKDRSAFRRQEAPLWDYRLTRQQVAQTIEQSWKQMTYLVDYKRRRVPGLSLDGMLHGPLPTLPAELNFDHVQLLSLGRMALDDSVAYFLKHFKKVKHLDLSGNGVTRLPQVLSQMSQLEYLCLADNALQLNEYARTTLAGMRSLQVLNLSNNALLNAPDVSHMFTLHELIARNCSLKEFPKGLSCLPYLENLDLRENNIRELPEWLFQMPRGITQTVNLRHNPLNANSEQRLSDYRKAYGIGMGYLEDDLTRLTEQRARELWLADERVARFSEKDLKWSGLRDEPGCEGLFNLLAQLGGTADTLHVREDMDRRVWRVLDEVAADSELREEVFQRAASGLNCDDAAAVSFSELEVLVEVHHATRLAETGQVNATPLLDLARRLFRLNQVRELAADHSLEHSTTDPLEVELAYRIGLAERFDLPGQPKHMRFASLSGVTPQALNEAENRVKVAELSPKLLKYLVELRFWVSHLKRTNQARFDSLYHPFNERSQTLFEQRLTLRDGSFHEQMNTIATERSRVETAELERLTHDAIKHRDLGLCQMS